jgi:hypothetical protein
MPPALPPGHDRGPSRVCPRPPTRLAIVPRPGEDGRHLGRRFEFLSGRSGRSARGRSTRSASPGNHARPPSAGATCRSRLFEGTQARPVCVRGQFLHDPVRGGVRLRTMPVSRQFPEPTPAGRRAPGSQATILSGAARRRRVPETPAGTLTQAARSRSARHRSADANKEHISLSGACLRLLFLVNRYRGRLPPPTERSPPPREAPPDGRG